MFLTDIAKKSWMIVAEAFSSFQRNDDLAAASAMAFSAMLAIIPALFLLTALLGMAMPSPLSSCWGSLPLQRLAWS
jgi:uncharacterized BrkB/YihY/UPF0761 family membrane protein